ncbi:hypothetical protein Tco_1409243, partial [Tanacetum coccineum]
TMAGVDIITLTMEQYLALSRENQAPGVVKPEIKGNVNFEIKSQFMRELREDTFSGNKNEDAHDHVDRVLNIGPIPGMTPTQALIAIQTMADHSQKWHDGTSNRNVSSSSNTDGLAAIVSKLDNLGCDMKKLKENVHVIQVGCQICEGLYLDKECPLNEEVKLLEEVKYGEFGRSTPFNGSNGSKFHVGPPGYYTRTDNRPPYREKRPSLEELMNKHQEESTRRSAKIKEWFKKLQENAEINTRNQSASLKNLETQIEQLTKELQARTTNGTPSSSARECKVVNNDHETQHRPISSRKVNDKKEWTTKDMQCQLPPKEVNPRNFTLPCTISNINFYGMPNLGASVNVMPRNTFEYLRLANLRNNNMLVEMADMKKKAPLGTDNANITRKRSKTGQTRTRDGKECAIAGIEIVSKKVVTPAPVKAVEEIYVTCSGPHAWYNCPNTDNNQASVCAAVGSYNQVNPPNRVSNQMAPPGFASVQNNSQNRFNNQGQGNNFNRGNNFHGNQGFQNQNNHAPNFQNQGFQNQLFQVPNNQVQQEFLSEFSNYKRNNDQMMRNMQNQINLLKGDLKNKIQNTIKSQQAVMMNQQTTFQNNLQNVICGLFQNQASTSGILPSNTIPNPKGEMKAITTRSGVAYEGPLIPTNPSPKEVVERETEETTDKEQTNFQGSTAQIPPSVIPISIPESDVPKSLPKPNIPYPSRRDD